jgi:hypothetical protein
LSKLSMLVVHILLKRQNIFADFRFVKPSLKKKNDENEDILQCCMNRNGWFREGIKEGHFFSMVFTNWNCIRTKCESSRSFELFLFFSSIL